MTVEFWAKPANNTQQGPAKIVTISKNTENRNMTIGQEGNSYELRFRSSVTDDNAAKFKIGEKREGESARITSTVFTVTTDNPSHVVMTRDKSGMLRLYINNQPPSELLVGGDLPNWRAIYSSALRAEEVNLNYIGGLNNRTPQSEMAEN